MDEENGELMVIGNGGYKKFVVFQAMNFGITLVVSFQLLPLVLGDRVCVRIKRGKYKWKEE